MKTWREERIAKHRPLVMGMVARWVRCYAPAAPYFEDLAQEGMLALVHAHRTYSPARQRYPRSFTRYARMVVQQRLLVAMRRQQAVNAGGSKPFAVSASLRHMEFDETHEEAEEPAHHESELKYEVLEMLTELRRRRTNIRWRSAEVASRDVDLFWRNRFEGEQLKPLGEPHGFCPERVRQICNEVGALFEELAEDYRKELE